MGGGGRGLGVPWGDPTSLSAPPPQTLNGSLTLELVNEKYWKVSKPLELYYAPTKEQK